MIFKLTISPKFIRFRKERELVKRERLAIKQLIAEHEYEVARAKAASCIRDELLSGEQKKKKKKKKKKKEKN
jgi:hypothetical protein